MGAVIDLKEYALKEYRAAGLNPEEDFHPSKTLAEKQLCLLRYNKMGFLNEPKKIKNPMLPQIFTKEEKEIIGNQERTTIKGRKAHAYYYYVAYGVELTSVHRHETIADRYTPILHRIMRDVARNIYNADKWSDLWEIREDHFYRIEQIVDAMSRKYNLHPRTAAAIGSLGHYHVIRKKKIKIKIAPQIGICEKCGCFHSNKQFMEIGFLGQIACHLCYYYNELAGPYKLCKTCMKKESRKIIAKWRRVEKRWNEVREISILLGNLKKEISRCQKLRQQAN